MPQPFLVDNLPGADGIGNFGQVAYVCGRVPVEHHEIGVKTFFHSALVGRLEIGGGICRERCEHLVCRQSTVHEFEFKRSVVDGNEPDIRAEKHHAAIRRKGVELLHACLNRATRYLRILNDSCPERECGHQRRVLGLEASQLVG